MEELAKNPVPDILFLDINMHGKDGLSCLKEIRADTRFDQMSVFMLSTSQSDKDVTTAFELGAGSYAIKPICLEAFSRILKTCLFKAAEQFLRHPSAKMLLRKDFVIR